MTVSRPNSAERDFLAPGQRVLRVHQHDEVVRSQRQRHQPALGGEERDDAEIEAALRHLNAHLTRRHPPHVDLNIRMLVSEPADQRQEGVHDAPRWLRSAPGRA